MILRSPLFCLLLLASASCAPRTVSTSNVKHDVGQLVVGRHPSYWANVSPTDHEKLVKKILELGDKQTDAKLTWEHPAISRLQTWVDAMDATARQTLWGQKYMAATPKPRLFFVDSESPNAFVAPAFVLYPADVNVPGNNGKTDEVGTVMSMVAGPNSLAASITKGLAPTVDGRKELLGDVVERQRFVLSKIGGTCLPQIVGAGKITYSGCKLNEDTAAQHGTEYMSKQTAPYVAVNLGLLRILDEEGVVATIAHELGHYYRAHATDESRLEGGFFYYEKDAAAGNRPKPIVDATLELQGREVLRAAMGRIPPPISGTAIDSELLMALMRSDVSDFIMHGYSDFKASDFPGKADEQGGVPTYEILLRKCRVNHPNKADCDAFERAIKNPAIQSVLKNLKAPDASAYRALESAFIIAMTDLKGGMSSGSVSVDSPEVSSSSLFFDPHTSTKRSADPYMVACGSAVTNQYVQTKKLILPFVQWLSLCSKELMLSRRTAEQKIGDFVLRGISWYTLEQEADEIAAELISSVGIEPLHATSHLWGLFKYVNEKRASVTGVDYATCQNLAKNNFGLGTGSVRTVALGDWSDIHHDLCYRIYNVSRDVHAHNYKADAKKRPQFSITWSDVVKSLPAPKGDGTPQSVNNGLFVE